MQCECLDHHLALPCIRRWVGRWRWWYWALMQRCSTMLLCLPALQAGLVDSVRQQAKSPEEGDLLAQEIQQLVRWAAGAAALKA